MQTLHLESGFGFAPNWLKIKKNDNDLTIFWHDVTVNFFWHSFVCPAKFSYWSKFHVNIITGCGIMIIFFYKGLTRNPGIGNTPVWILPNIWRLGQLRDKFGTNVSNKKLLNAAKCQGYSSYHFWVIKGKPTGDKITAPPSITQISIKCNILDCCIIHHITAWISILLKSLTYTGIKNGDFEKLNFVM